MFYNENWKIIALIGELIISNKISEIDHIKWIYIKVFVCFWSNVRMNVPSSSQQRRKNMFYACKVSDVCKSGVHQKRFIGLIKYNE